MLRATHLISDRTGIQSIENWPKALEETTGCNSATESSNPGSVVNIYCFYNLGKTKKKTWRENCSAETALYQMIYYMADPVTTIKI